jgi:hypothetical protein
MKMKRNALLLSLLISPAALLACDEPKATSAVDATVEAAPPSAPSGRPGEGCARAGTIEGVETDPTCVLAKVSDDVMKDFGRRLTLRLAVEPETVIAGSSALLRLTITNIASSETLVVFDAYPRGAGPRPDWSRLAGVPDVKGEQPDVPRLQLAVSTADTHDHPVDAVPLVANPGGSFASARILGVRLRPGAKLTSALSWHALRIPAPAPIFKDDAGHRFVPKTTAVPLYAGEYVISVDVPLHGLAPAERTVTTRARVEKPERDR